MGAFQVDSPIVLFFQDVQFGRCVGSAVGEPDAHGGHMFDGKSNPDILGHQIRWIVAAINLADRQHPPGLLLLDPQVINLNVAHTRYTSTFDHPFGRGRIYVHSGLELHTEVTGKSQQAQCF